MNPDLLKKLEASLQAKFPVRRHECLKEGTTIKQVEVDTFDPTALVSFARSLSSPTYRQTLRKLKKRKP